jgi:integrase/recombinase XerD
MKAEIFYSVKYMQTRRYSEKTITNYIHHIQEFLDHFNTDPKLISDQQVRDYVFNKVFPLHRSASYQNIMVNALKLFYRAVVLRPISDEVFIRPKKSHYLPTVLSTEEVSAIIDSIKNLKHKTIISTIYACGLRISEAINLQIRDIDSKRMVIYIRQAKGKKDRTLPLSGKLLQLLREYWSVYRPVCYLFEGVNKEKYSVNSISAILARAVSMCRITKRVTVHTLRHSYATHLMDAGVNLRFIQTMLGHSYVRTTEIYTHVSKLSLQNVYSPLDDVL